MHLNNETLGSLIIWLTKCTWESVENKSEFAVILFDSIADDSYNDIIRNKPTSLHDSLCLLSNFSLSSYSCTEHIPSRQLRNSKKIFNLWSMSSLSSSSKETKLNHIITTKYSYGSIYLRWSKKNQDITWPVG